MIQSGELAAPAASQRQLSARSGAENQWLSAAGRIWRNPVGKFGVVILATVTLVAILAPVLAPYSPYVQIPGQELRLPSRAHPFGSDELGHDLLSRLMYGARISMSVGFVAMAIGLTIGVVLGSLAGFFGGFVDAFLMRLTDGMLAIPYFFLILIVVAVFGSSVRNLILVIGLTSWMAIARIVRSEVLRLKGQEFVIAAESIGVSSGRILARHIVPHAVPSIIVAATLGIANAILLESALSYLGVGVRPPEASWGNMLSNSQAYLWNNPLLPVYPGVLIFVSVLAFNFVGDALRDALDPRLKS